MLRHTARLLVVTLVLGSGRLLACGVECVDAIVPVEAACHQEPADSGAIVIGGVVHECPPEVLEPPVTPAHKSDPHLLIGAALGPSRTVLPALPSISRFASALVRSHSPVPHPLPSSVLRI